MPSEPNAQSTPRTSGSTATPFAEGGRSSLGKYQIARQLGAGGMGTVYLAVDTQLKRTVALKVLPRERAENETLVMRFEAEATAAAQLKHENIITVYDAGRVEGHLFIALEYVDGADVHELVAKRGVLPLKRSIDFVKQVTRALQHLHQRGIVHRDIKPSNLLVTKEGIVKLTDMGLARAVDESLQSNITREGTTVGTVDFMAPEQARNSQAADIRSDIYSLGCTWYQMLTGEPPYPSGSVTNKLFSHISKPRPDPRELNRAVPEEVVAVMHRMMARKPTDRYQTPDELMQDLENLGKGATRFDDLLRSEADEAAASAPTPARGTPGASLPPRRANSRAVEFNSSKVAPGPSKAGAAARLPARNLPGRNDAPPHAGSTPRRTAVSDDPVSLPPREGEYEAALADEIEWKKTATKVTVGACAVVLVVLAVWAASSWWSANERRPTADDKSTNPFAPGAPELQDAAEPAVKKTVEGAKTPDAKPSADAKPADKEPKSAVVVAAKKAAGDEKPLDMSTVIGRPNERPKFPAWIADVWDPAARTSSGSAGPLKTLTVGRVGQTPADVLSVAEAIEQLPPEGGVIELRGRGPFILPAIRIANRRHLIVTGVPSATARSDTARSDTAKSDPAKPGTGPLSPARPAAIDERPLIAVVPAGDPAVESGIMAANSSLTFYGVDIVANAELFPGEQPLRVIDVRAGDVALRHSTVTILGARPATALSLSGPLETPDKGHSPRILLDRTLIRGRAVTAIDADLRNVDLLAINSLFLTGKSPVLNLSAEGTGAGPSPQSGVQRTLRFFSCTSCTDDTAISLRLGAGGPSPPTTHLIVLNSVFGVVYSTQGATMIALNNWPMRSPGPETRVPVENLTLSCDSFVARGWRRLIQTDAGAQFSVIDGGRWADFWGNAGAGFVAEPNPFSPAGDPLTSDPSQFKSEVFTTAGGNTPESGNPGCDTALLSVPSPDLLGRADAFSKRPVVPTAFLAARANDASVREINLDNNQRRDWENLAKHINETQWPSGTRFVVKGTGHKTCGPIHVSGKSFSIEFSDKIPLLLLFEDKKGELRGDRQSFISVTGGTAEIVNANFRVESTKKPSARWWLEVSDGSFSIRDSTIQGPQFDNPGFAGLIRYATRDDAGGSTGKNRPIGHVRNSFLRAGQTVFDCELASSDVIIENSVLASASRAFELNGRGSAGDPPTLDIRSSTLSAAAELFHLDPAAAGKGRVRVFAEETVFAPPVAIGGASAAHPVLIGGAAPAAIAQQIDWWDYGCTISNLIAAPGSGANPPVASDGLSGWRQLAGPFHVSRSILDPGAVILSARDLPPIKEVTVNHFRLTPEAQASTWSDLGTAIGSTLPTAEPVAAAKPPAPAVKKPKASRSRDVAPAMKDAQF